MACQFHFELCTTQLWMTFQNFSITCLLFDLLLELQKTLFCLSKMWSVTQYTNSHKNYSSYYTNLLSRFVFFYSYWLNTVQQATWSGQWHMTHHLPSTDFSFSTVHPNFSLKVCGIQTHNHLIHSIVDTQLYK